MTDGATTGRTWLLVVLGFLAAAGLTVLLLALLTNIFERKQEARQPFVRLVEVTEDTMDPKVWGQNWPAEYDSYLKTSLPTATEVRRPRSRRQRRRARRSRSSTGSPGCAASSPATPSRSTIATVAVHAFALFDQEQTRRVTEKKQPGACLQCHAANLALVPLRRQGRRHEGLRAGQRHALRAGAQHERRQGPAPDPAPARLRGLPRAQDDGAARHAPGIHRRASRRSRPSRASPTTTRTAMPRARRCGRTSAASATWSTTSRAPSKVVTYPWANGLKVEEIEAYYDKEGFTDWTHAETGTKMLKAQHPEFEVWNQGIHARAAWRAPTATCPISGSARSR